ncbi:VOC family protein [Phycicoccus endophyticus]|uniref:VOC family protein n=1 Tax=Phycicoccus endophyticus TaxID=1690220 RepID=A0A7G9R221_9MICO|nr:VOC family protein [Phycicoccus endophyticus]NHI19714.1 catechol 2,3-dioxygenase [Phycicoccus endophyticus]QNN49646.1 VOC family protein [Phycicoccus endophyticus]GGL33625.1 catechol 2,3-dioxygenase [Phycicoccus endophyticus]
MERIRDIAHLSAVELRTPDLEATTDFFVRLLGLDEVRREDGVVHLHCWDDYEGFTLRVVAHETSGIGRTWLRTAGPAALERRVAALEERGHRGSWEEGAPGLGPTYVVPDPDGHLLALYWESEPYRPPERLRPSLKNQAAAFPGRGATVRRLDHVNYLARDVAANGSFLADALGARLSEQIVLDDGTQAACWYTVTDKSYDLVHTTDWTGLRGRLHHIAFATDTREDILRAADVFLDNDVFIETGPHKHAIQQTFFLYVYEPGGNRVELCNAGARLLLSPDSPPVTWTEAERAKGQAWGLKTIESFHTHGTPPVGE